MLRIFVQTYVGAHGNTIQDGSKTNAPCDMIREIWSGNKIDKEIRLLPNKICGYTSVQEYLDIHYNLLQEDFLYPLKQDLETLKSVTIEAGSQVNFGLSKMCDFYVLIIVNKIIHSHNLFGRHNLIQGN